MAKSASVKSSVVAALEYLAHPEKYAVGPAVAVPGDEAFLKREVLAELRRQVLGDGGDEFSLTTLGGSEVSLRDVLDALATVSLFGVGRRMVVVEQADAFVSEHRAELEAYVERPAKGGVLVLDVKSWPSNTRLAKAVAAGGLTIDCTPLKSESQTKKWLAERASKRYEVRLDASAADALLELLPADLGILDQELAKLSVLVGKSGPIDAKLVQEHVGGWRTRTTWEMVDAAAEGRAAEALGQLGRLIAAGEKPQALMPQVSHVLRQLATATRLIQSTEASGGRISLHSALQQAGVPPFKLAAAEQQLRQIGRERGQQLTAWLLAADLAMKGHNSADARARLEIERIIVRLSAAANRSGSAAPQRTGVRVPTAR